MKHERAAILIPTFNEASVIGESLTHVQTAVEEYGRGNINIFVIDNRSTDGTPEIVSDFSKGAKNLSLLTEPKRGVGHARRTGARAAITSMLQETRSSETGLWILTTDADALVPKSWITDWFSVFSEIESGIATGDKKFPEEFMQTHPNSATVLNTVARQLSKVEKILGPINTDGTNMAIDVSHYAAVGPFNQPTRKNVNGQIENLAGEDWDMGTRARSLGLEVYKNSHTPVVTSPRRFHHNPREFLDGTVYEGEFRAIRDVVPSRDILPEEIDELTLVALQRQTMHHIAKPLLVDHSLLERPEVQDFLGEDLHHDVSVWLEKPRPDIFSERQAFIEDHLVEFNETFGFDFAQCLQKI